MSGWCLVHFQAKRKIHKSFKTLLKNDDVWLMSGWCLDDVWMTFVGPTGRDEHLVMGVVIANPGVEQSAMGCVIVLPGGKFRGIIPLMGRSLLKTPLPRFGDARNKPKNKTNAPWADDVQNNKGV